LTSPATWAYYRRTHMDTNTQTDTQPLSENTPVVTAQEAPPLAASDIPMEVPKKKKFPFIPVVSGLVIVAAFGFVMVNYQNKQITNSKAADEAAHSYATCIATKDSKVLQTDPPICVFPDGTRVVESPDQFATGGAGSSTVPGGTAGSTKVVGVGEMCGGFQGKMCPSGSVCVYTDGTTDNSQIKRPRSADASGTCQPDTTSKRCACPDGTACPKGDVGFCPEAVVTLGAGSNPGPLSGDPAIITGVPTTRHDVQPIVTEKTVPIGYASDWEKCLKSNGSKVLETYPAVCVFSSGARVTDPSANVITPPVAITGAPDSVAETTPDSTQPESPNDNIEYASAPTQNVFQTIVTSIWCGLFKQCSQ
jgi:hypothetical protein